MGSKYDINFKRLALLLLPTFWRRPIISAFVYTIIAPISFVYNRFTKLRQESDYRLYHNGQVCYLRAVVNDYFDPIERRITITDGEDHDLSGGVIIYQRSQDRQRLIPRRSRGAIFLNQRGWGGVNYTNFIVNVPRELRASIDEQRLQGVINTYRLASMRYAIIYC